MFDPMTIGIGALLFAVFKKQSNTHFGQTTPERAEVYRNAMEYCHDPNKLVELAKDFEKFGLKAEAHCLKMRAKWRSRTPEQKKAHDEIFAKAMRSEKVEGILEVARIFESMTATIKAAQLRERAKSLTEQKAVEPEVVSKSEGPQGGSNPNGMSRHTDETGESEVRPVAQA